MVTLNKYNDSPNRSYMELYGLSTDEKPIKKYREHLIGNASVFLEMDTGDIYLYDEENSVWHKF